MHYMVAMDVESTYHYTLRVNIVAMHVEWRTPRAHVVTRLMVNSVAMNAEWYTPRTHE